MHREDGTDYMLSWPGVFFDGIAHMSSIEDHLLGFECEGNIWSKTKLPETDSLGTNGLAAQVGT